MSHYITVRVELEDGTIAEKRTEIDRIGNPHFIAFETRQSAAVAVDEVVAMLTATKPEQIYPRQVSS